MRARASIRRAIWALAMAAIGTLQLETSAVAQTPREVSVEASQYRFDPEVIEVEQGEHVRLVFRSADVEHGFALPELGLSIRIPESGAAVALEFVAQDSGSFAFGCSEYCGAGHASMTGTLVVRPAPGAAAAAPPDTGEPVLDEADFNLVNLPTTLPVERGRAAFRVTHRFARGLGAGSFSDLLSDFFSLDGGAQIGLEFRYGLFERSQIGIYRTSDRTIQFFGRQGLLAQGRSSPIGLDLSLSIEGRDNFQEEHSPSLGVVLSSRLGSRLALYAAPSFVGNTNLTSPEGSDEDQHTFILGLGARIHILPTVAFVAEASPRLGGFDGRPGDKSNDFYASFGVEKIVGGHVFALNFSNDIGTTPAQIARGQQGPEDWFLGFNISRRF